MNTDNEVWWLDANEIDRIKAGVLKYVTLNSKSKEKIPMSPSSPRSQMGSSVRSQKSDKNGRLRKPSAAINSPRPKETKREGMKRPNPTDKMPKGYYLDSKGKIMREQQESPDQDESVYSDVPFFQLENDYNGEMTILINSPKKLSENKLNYASSASNHSRATSKNLISEDNEIQAYDNISDISFNLFSKPTVATLAVPKQAQRIKNSSSNNNCSNSKELGRVEGRNRWLDMIKQGNDNQSEEKIKEIKQKGEVKEQRIQQISSVTAVEEFKPKSVSEIAKMFGASKTKLKEDQQPKIKQPVIPDQENKPKSIFEIAKMFGGNKMTASKPSQEISILKQEKSMPNQNAKTQASSTAVVAAATITEANSSQPVGMPVLVQSPIRKYEPNSMRTKNHEKSQLKTISFSEGESEELKKKYNLLSLRLDTLKEKVLQECKQDVVTTARKKKMQAWQQNSSKDSIRLYQEYSPLRKLHKAIKDKSQEKAKKLTHQRVSNASISLKDFLRK